MEALRHVIRESAPEAEETTSYGMPAFKHNGILIYFAAWGNHIGFYPTALGIEAFEKELSPYKYSKGAIRFSLDEPIPFDLVKKNVKYRLQENAAKKKRY